MTTEELSAELRLVVAALHKALRKEMAHASSYSMTELETIVHIFRNKKMLPTHLAAIARISTPSMSQILKKMEEQGFIQKTPSAEDKRKVYVSMTELGKHMLENARYSKDEYLKNLIDTKLSAKEKELLEKAIPVLNKLMIKGI